MRARARVGELEDLLLQGLPTQRDFRLDALHVASAQLSHIFMGEERRRCGPFEKTDVSRLVVEDHNGTAYAVFGSYGTAARGRLNRDFQPDDHLSLPGGY